MHHTQLISHLIERICVETFYVGSPSYGAMKYEVPACDLTLIKQRHVLPVGEKTHMFGIKMRSGATWSTYLIEMPDCVAQLQRLNTFGVHTGQFVHEHRVEYGRVRDKLISDQIDWVGHIHQLHDVLAYLDLVQS